MEHAHTRENSPSPRPPENLVAPLIQEVPSILAPTRTESDIKDSAWSSSSPSAEKLHSTDKSPFSSLQSLRPKLANLTFEPKPLFQGFERPSLSRIAILTVLCAITYPAFHILTLVAKDKSLFVVRAIVSVWCSGAGFALGYILLKIGKQHLEAASESVLPENRDFLSLYFKQPGRP